MAAAIHSWLRNISKHVSFLHNLAHPRQPEAHRKESRLRVFKALARHRSADERGQEVASAAQDPDARFSLQDTGRLRGHFPGAKRGAGEAARSGARKRCWLQLFPVRDAVCTGRGVWYVLKSAKGERFVTFVLLICVSFYTIETAMGRQVNAQYNSDSEYVKAVYQ